MGGSIPEGMKYLSVILGERLLVIVLDFPAEFRELLL